MKKVLGVGAALVDLLANVDDAWVEASGNAKGDMTMVEFDTLEKLLAKAPKTERVPGGSAANTMVGLAKLGGNAAFLSKIKDDELGNLYNAHLKSAGVQPILKSSDVATGCVLSVVTPDAQRTMFSFLGASNTLCDEDVTEDLFEGVDLVYLEGYRAFAADTFRKILNMAKERGIKTAVDFGSFGVVNVCHALFEEMFAGHKIDMIFANEDEAKAYTGKEPMEALEELSKYCEVAIVKIGKKGAYISENGVVTQVAAGTAKAIDTTGAGDLWAAGYLYGYLNGFSAEKSGKLASAVADEVVQVQGAMIPESGWNRIESVKNA